MLKRYSSRRLARLSAIQAIYQYFQTKEDANKIIEQFINHHFANGSMQSKVKVDSELFVVLLEKTIENLGKIEAIISNHLVKNWTIKKLSQIILSILNCAICEFLIIQKTPKAVLINEYIEISKDFLNEDEIKFINKVLDMVANQTSCPIS